MKTAEKGDASTFLKDTAIYNDGECFDDNDDSHCSTAASKNI